MSLAAFWLYTTSNAWSTYAAFAVACAIWALTVSNLAFCHLKTRPGRPLEPGWGYVGTNVRRLRTTMRSIWTEQRQLLIFLLAWFVHSDGAATVGAGASLFAAHDLKMPAFVIMASLLELSVVAIIGAQLSVYVHQHQLLS